MAVKKPYETEAALCADFIAIATADGKWTAYAETGGFDLLLVRKADGFQIGVEAKLTLNTKVVVQALPEGWYGYAETGPDCRAALVPYGQVQNGLTTICGHLGITVLTLRPADGSFYRVRPRDRIDPALPDQARGFGSGFDRHWHEWCPISRIKLPEYVPDVAAGDSAPVKLTGWKIAAIKLCILMEGRPVTRRDFKLLGLDPRRWTDHWLRPTPQGYVRCEATPDLKAQHPVVYEQIRADAGRWMTGELSMRNLFEAAA